jgi:hypothetical protein
MWKRDAVAFLLPPVLVLSTVFAVRHWTQPVQPQPAPQIPAPHEWVAFSGDVKVTHGGIRA